MACHLFRQAILIALPLLVVGQCNYDQKCWFASVGCTMAKGNPFERRAFISCDECLKLCLDRKNGPAPYCCKSVVYDSQWKFCDLFAIQAQTQADFVKYPGRTYLSPSGNCTTSTPAGSTPSPIAECPPGQKAILSIFKNVSSPAMDGAVPINADTSDKCGLLCIQNKDDKGNPVPCKAASFSQGRCLFSSQPASTNSIQNLKPGADANSLYLEKKCYPADQAGSCEAVILDPHHVLVGYNRKTVDASSYDQCLQACITAKQKFGFSCNSGQYYPDVSTDNCVLNEETVETKPDLYLGTDDNNIYFEPHCATGQRLIYATKRRARARLLMRDGAAFDQEFEQRWSDWSSCDKMTNTMHRFKNCFNKRHTECEKQVVPCDYVDLNAIVQEQAKNLLPCKPIIKNNRMDCSTGVRDSLKGHREYGCVPNTRECWGKNFS